MSVRIGISVHENDPKLALKIPLAGTSAPTGGALGSPLAPATLPEEAAPRNGLFVTIQGKVVLTRISSALPPLALDVLSKPRLNDQRPMTGVSAFGAEAL